MSKALEAFWSFVGNEGTEDKFDSEIWLACWGHRQREINGLRGEIKKLRESIDGALKISDLWIPEIAEAEFKDEVKALHSMRTNFLECTKKYKETE